MIASSLYNIPRLDLAAAEQSEVLVVSRETRALQICYLESNESLKDIGTFEEKL